MNGNGPLHILLGAIVMQIVLLIAWVMIIYMENTLHPSSSIIPVIFAIEVLLTALDFGMIYAIVKGSSE
jgi:uncharacterized membrane protein YhdT